MSDSARDETCMETSSFRVDILISPQLINDSHMRNRRIAVHVAFVDALNIIIQLL